MAIIYTVPQAHCTVIERFGKFSRVQNAGIRFKIPFIERHATLEKWAGSASKKSHLIELTEQQTDTQPRQCHTKDNVPVTTNASVYWRVLDARAALYEVDALPKAIADVALNALRSNLGALELDSVLADRQSLNDRIAAQLSETAAKWGVQFTRVEIQQLDTSAEVSTAMIQQMDAERGRRAAIAESEGEAVAKVKIAEAQKLADILRAEGKAKALELVSEAEQKYLDVLSKSTTPESAAQILLAQKYLDGFATITQNPSDKVFIPNTFQGLFSFPLGGNDKPTVAPD